MKVLFISKMDMASVDLFEHMQNELEVQMCTFVSDVVRRMIKIVAPNVIFVMNDDSYSEMAYSKLVDDAGDIPIVVLCDRDDDAINKFNLPDIHYLIKPISATKIVNKIKSFEIVVVEETEEPEIVEEESIPEGSIPEGSIPEGSIPEDVYEDIQEESSVKKILAVDDNALVLRTISSILKDEYNVSVAPSVQVAIRFMENKKYDLILLDYDMPKMDGFAALQYIKRDPDLRDIPVVFLTGVADKARIAKVFKYMPEGYLLKPIEVDKLKKKIHELIGEENDKLS